ncbi:hypothetical protein [Halolamina litorea]|jgi:hypothetical protein|uniref:Transposon-encoded protein n=1 Tax=Halolamina litorea TaxID=1515593 RepID=A0ABD6BLR4_9EURY|nr:hypothetical protein [Halolamina litorea]
MKEAEDTRVVIPRDIVTKKTDSRGRITLGSEYADEEVTVAVIEVSE